MQKWWLQCEWPILWITARSFCSEADDKNYMRLNKFSILCWNLKTDNVLCTVFKDIFFAVLGPMRICLEHFASWSWLLVGWPIPIWLHNASYHSELHQVRQCITKNKVKRTIVLLAFQEDLWMLLQGTVATVYFQQTEHGIFEHVSFSYTNFPWFWHASRKLVWFAIICSNIWS